MRRFNPEKELNKIQNGGKKKILLGVCLLLIIIAIGSSYALYQVRYSKRIIYTKVAPFSNKDINILAIYLDNELTDEFPKKGSKVAFDRVDCDNGSTGAFNTNTWKLILEAEGKDKCSVYFRTTTDYIDDSGANPPELYQGLIPVTFDTSGNMKVADLTTDWYDYDDKRWANAVLVDYTNQEVKSAYFNEDGSLKTDIANKDIPMNYVLQMYVWIPRYKYQLFNANYEGVEPQEIKIEFESGTLSTGEVSCEISSKGVETCTNAINGNWYTHPAFKFGNTELTGIWVGKFEPSGSVTALTIKPNITSLRTITLKTMFNASRNIEETYANTFNLNKEEIDTRVMKNMEWGAMAYLTNSKYGRCDGKGTCTEVAMNARSDYITGYNGTGYTWQTANGQLASTTGNMYGIYDTNGGAWDYVMAVTMIDTVGSGIQYSSSGFSAADLKEKEKYYELYEYDTIETSHRRGHLGDATRETLKTFGSNVGGWYDDYATFPNNTYSWFRRGSSYNNGNLSGTFAFDRNVAEGGAFNSFRVVLTAQDGDS